MKHPSLNTELLEPKWRGIYSFRSDRKYRALFFITKRGTAEITALTKYYKK
jgi:plasmid maintenance system killer protein